MNEWFDKLFGEDNGSNDDYLNKRSQRRQKLSNKKSVNHYFHKTMTFMKDQRENFAFQ